MRYEDLLTHTRAGLSQAPDLVIVRALRRAGAKFFRESMVWQEQLDPVKTRPGVSAYELEAPGRVERIMWAKHDGRLLRTGGRPRELEALHAGQGAPQYWALDSDTQTIELHPAPDDALMLVVYAALVPTHDADGLPDALMEDYRDGLISLARADVMGNTPGMPYHDPQAAAVQYRFGSDAIVRAKRKQMSGGWTQMRVRPRPFV